MRSWGNGSDGKSSVIAILAPRKWTQAVLCASPASQPSLLGKLQASKRPTKTNGQYLRTNSLRLSKGGGRGTEDEEGRPGAHLYSQKQQQLDQEFKDPQRCSSVQVSQLCYITNSKPA